MAEPKMSVFFYGSYINFDVLRKVDLVPERWEVARLDGFDIRILPRASLVHSDQHYAYGIVATATHAELDRSRRRRTCFRPPPLTQWDRRARIPAL